MNREPPNGGVPPGVAFFGGVPNDDATLPSYSQDPAVSTVPAPSSSPPAGQPPFEPPGIRFHGKTFEHEGKAYLFPAEHVIVHFFHNGRRPFEEAVGSNYEFLEVYVSTKWSVQSLMWQLGIPKTDNDRYGITECIEGENGAWSKGTTFILSQDRSKKTLAQVGWSHTRTNPVWLAVYDQDRHGQPDTDQPNAWG